MKITSMLRWSVCVISLCLLSSAVFADKAVTLDRVRWKKSVFVWEDHPDYPEWKNEGIWTEFRKNTFISRYWNPGPANARTMIVIISGQQGASGSSGSANCLTGQTSTWDDNWGSGDRSKTVYVKDLSLSGRLIDSGFFNPYDTFLGIVFNSNFNWENTSSAKAKAERAFTSWLLKHGNSGVVERIFILGSSRGGVLAARIAKKIRQTSGWGATPIYAGLLDAVPNTTQNELYTSGQPTCTNPLNSSYYSRRADLAAYFSGLIKPFFRHVVTGAPVILGTAVHSFCADASTWYDQTWENYEHTEIGRCVFAEGQPYDTALMEAGIVRLYQWVLDQM